MDIYLVSLVKLMTITMIEGTNPNTIIIDIIKDTSCHRKTRFELEMPDENFTIDCPNSIIAIIDHSVL